MKDDIQIVGCKITAIRFLSPEEQEIEGWEIGAVEAIELDNGVVIFASDGDEGNNPGTLFGQHSGVTFYVHPGTI